jgi:ERF superfamily protein
MATAQPSPVAAAPSPADQPQAPEGRPQELAPSGAPDAILAMIERAARDTAVDVDKFERLMALRERVETQRASIAFAEAFAELQPDLPVIDRRGNIVVFSKTDREKAGGVPADARPIQKTPYATLDDILEALRKPLAEHGFSVRFEYQTTSDNRLATTAILRHRLGHEERATTPPLQHDTTGSKNNVQAAGSALTYGRRYALMAVLPIVSHAPQDADDDGKAAGDAVIGLEEILLLEQQLRDTDSDQAKFLEKLGAESLAAMTVSQFKRGKALLAEKKRRANAGPPRHG